MHNYGEALQYHREVAGLSLMELGRQVGISPQNIGRWERGEVLPNIDFCVRIAAFYGISVNELLGVSDGGTKQIAVPILSGFSSEERKLVDNYRELNQSGKKLINETIKTLLATAGGSEQKRNNITEY